MKGTINTAAYKEILYKFILLSLWEQLGDGPFQFQHDCEAVYKAISIKTWMSKFDVDIVTDGAAECVVLVTGSERLKPVSHFIRTSSGPTEVETLGGCYKKSLF